MSYTTTVRSAMKGDTISASLAIVAGQAANIGLDLGGQHGQLTRKRHHLAATLRATNFPTSCEATDLEDRSRDSSKRSRYRTSYKARMTLRIDLKAASFATAARSGRMGATGNATIVTKVNGDTAMTASTRADIARMRFFPFHMWGENVRLRRLS